MNQNRFDPFLFDCHNIDKTKFSILGLYRKKQTTARSQIIKSLTEVCINNVYKLVMGSCSDLVYCTLLYLLLFAIYYSC